MFSQVPFYMLFIGTAVIVLISVEGGYRLGKYVQNRKPDLKVPPGAMIQNALALLSFLLAFTFGVAANNYNTRRELVVQEANSIGTTYLRTDFLPEGSDRKEIQNLLRKYVEYRLQLSHDLLHAKDEKQTIEQAIVNSDRIQNQLWVVTTNVGKSHSDSLTVALFVQSMNEMFDIQSRRISCAVYKRLPDFLWGMLYLMLVLGMLGTGYLAGRAGAQSWTSNIVATLSFAMVMTIIADLDRPYDGFFRTNQRPLLNLGIKIGAKAPE